MKSVEKIVISETAPNLTNVGWYQPSTKKTKFFVNGAWQEPADKDTQADYTEADNTSPAYIKNKPVVDNTPTQDSTNLVTSGGVYTALSSKIEGVGWVKGIVLTQEEYDNLQEYEETTLYIII